MTENVLMAAALNPGKTTIVGASPNYMVQDMCFFLEKLGIKYVEELDKFMAERTGDLKMKSSNNRIHHD